MNRADRRKAERAGRNTQAELDFYHDKAVERIQKTVKNNVLDMLESTKKSTTKAACDIMTCVFAIALNNEYGFGTTRINRILSRVKLQLECINDGHLSAGDIKRWCEENKINL